MNVSRSDRAPVSREPALPVVVSTPDAQTLFVPLLSELSRIDAGAREQRAELRDEQEREALETAETGGIAAATQTLQQREAAALRGDAATAAREEALRRAQAPEPRRGPADGRSADDARSERKVSTPADGAVTDDAAELSTGPKGAARTAADGRDSILRPEADRPAAPAARGSGPQTMSAMSPPMAAERAAPPVGGPLNPAVGVTAVSAAGAEAQAATRASTSIGAAAPAPIGSAAAGTASGGNGERVETPPVGAAAPAGSARAGVAAGRAAPELRGDGAENASFERLLRAVRGRLKESRSTMTLRLDPPRLGSLRVWMTVDRGRVTLDVATQTHLAHRMLTGEVESLRRALEAVGAQLDAFVVREPDAQEAASDPDAFRPDADTAGHGRPHADTDRPRTAPETDLHTAGATEGAATESLLAWTTESFVNVLA
ncbi:MAG: hypothetical protein CHACPFDD_00991 [Phycisphaerae bacterium]|nr:hypothetical protein [Phycisphaerae bacterium]